MDFKIALEMVKYVQQNGPVRHMDILLAFDDYGLSDGELMACLDYGVRRGRIAIEDRCYRTTWAGFFAVSPKLTPVVYRTWMDTPY